MEPIDEIKNQYDRAITRIARRNGYLGVAEGAMALLGTRDFTLGEHEWYYLDYLPENTVVRYAGRHYLVQTSAAFNAGTPRSGLLDAAGRQHYSNEFGSTEVLHLGHVVQERLTTPDGFLSRFFEILPLLTARYGWCSAVVGGLGDAGLDQESARRRWLRPVQPPESPLYRLAPGSVLSCDGVNIIRVGAGFVNAQTMAPVDPADGAWQVLYSSDTAAVGQQITAASFRVGQEITDITAGQAAAMPVGTKLRYEPRRTRWVKGPDGRWVNDESWTHSINPEMYPGMWSVERVGVTVGDSLSQREARLILPLGSRVESGAYIRVHRPGGQWLREDNGQAEGMSQVVRVRDIGSEEGAQVTAPAVEAPF